MSERKRIEKLRGYIVKHELKCWPESFREILNHRKNFEVRKNDRGYHIGDVLHLREWEPFTGRYIGAELDVKVEYILHGGLLGIDPEYCVMSITEHCAAKREELTSDAGDSINKKVR